MTEPGLTAHDGGQGSGQGSRQGDAQSGVTLVEIVVALAVIGLTLAVAASGMRLLAHSGDRGADLIARHDILSRGIDVLRRDIERLQRAVWKRGDTAEFVFRGEATRLALVAVEPPFPTEAGPYLIAYSIRQRRDGAVLTRDRAPFPVPVADWDRLSTADSVAVIEGPYRLRFQYLDRREGRERWLSQWSDPDRLPALVALEVTGLADRGSPMPPVVFRPRIDAELGCTKDESSLCTTGTDGTLRPESEAGARGGNQP